MIHDIGKIGLPTEILSKPAKLIDMEFNLIKNHSKIGYDILKSIEFTWPIAQIVFQHHERLNGTGYPEGLRGSEIMVEARIIAVADVFEAMTAKRPYGGAYDMQRVFETLESNSGKLYDEEAVDACVELFTKDNYRLN